jgi:hypothetical protein
MLPTCANFQAFIACSAFTALLTKKEPNPQIATDILKNNHTICALFLPYLNNKNINIKDVIKSNNPEIPNIKFIT